MISWRWESFCDRKVIQLVGRALKGSRSHNGVLALEAVEVGW